MSIPTRMNGGIPPTIRFYEMMAVEYAIGTGERDDPIRLVTAFYLRDGKHLFTFHEPVSDGTDDQ